MSVRATTRGFQMRVDLRRWFAIPFCLAVALALAASSDPPPPHLASLVARFYDALRDKLARTPADSKRRAALERAREILRASGARYWAKDPVIIPGIARTVADELGLDLTKRENRETVLRLLTGTPDDRREILKSLRGLTNPAEIESALRDLDQSGSLSDMTTRHSITTESGERMDIIWRPWEQDLVIRLSGETTAGAPLDHETNLLAGTPLTVNPETGDLDVGLSPADNPIQILTAEELAVIRASIFGEWETEDGQRWIFASATGDLDAGIVRRSPEEIDADLARLAKRREEIQRAKEYIWVDVNSGEIVRQRRFRRLGAPWEYQGEEYLMADAEAKIAEIDDQIGALESEKMGAELPPVERHDPIGWNEALEVGARPITIETVQQEPDCRYGWDDASFDGRMIRARRVHREICSMKEDLPQVVKEQLLASWSPPAWLELQVRRDPSTAELSMEGSYWGLHVTYSGGLFGDNSVESIHTPYSTPIVMRKPGTKMNVAFGASDEMTP